MHLETLSFMVSQLLKSSTYIPNAMHIPTVPLQNVLFQWENSNRMLF